MTTQNHKIMFVLTFLLGLLLGSSVFAAGKGGPIDGENTIVIPKILDAKVAARVAATNEYDGSKRIYRCSFEECATMALRNNPQIRAVGYEREMAFGKLDEASPRGIPVLKYEYKLAPAPQDIDNAAESFFNGDITPFNSFKVEAGSLLTSFGKLKTAQELAGIGIDATWFKRQKTEDDVIGKIYQIYQGILLGKELMNLAEQANSAITGKITELKKEKVVDQLQILKLKVALFEVDRQVEEARKRLKLAYYALQVQLGLPDDMNVDIKSSGLVPVRFSLKPLKTYLAASKEYLPDIKLLEKGMQAKEKQLKLEKMAPVPNLAAGAFFDIGRAPNTVGGADENSFTNPFNYTKAGVGVQLKGEFDWVKTKAKVRQAKADLLKVANERQAAIRGLELDVEKSYLEVEQTRAVMLKATEEKTAAKQIVFLTKTNADIGVGEKKDYQDALQSFVVLQGREYESIFNYNVAVSQLKIRVGQLYREQRKDQE